MNNNQRGLKTIETPIGKVKVEIKTWLTGGEKRDVTNSMLSNTIFNSTDMKDFNVKGDMLSKIQDTSIKTVVVTIDGKTDNILETILEMRSEDYEFILNECTNITNGKVEEDVKKKLN